MYHGTRYFHSSTLIEHPALFVSELSININFYPQNVVGQWSCGARLIYWEIKIKVTASPYLAPGGPGCSGLIEHNFLCPMMKNLMKQCLP